MTGSAVRIEARKRVLVVDDEPAILKILGIKLRISGYDVVTASSGEEALALIRSTRPDIILLDVIMPGIDGFEVLQQVRAVSELPVIVFSARPENGHRAFTLGASDFLAKPLDVEEMVGRIGRLLGQES
jgi:DNA-binding response OmpR family regulator